MRLSCSLVLIAVFLVLQSEGAPIDVSTSTLEAPGIHLGSIANAAVNGLAGTLLKREILPLDTNQLLSANSVRSGPVGHLAQQLTPIVGRITHLRLPTLARISIPLGRYETKRDLGGLDTPRVTLQQRDFGNAFSPFESFSSLASGFPGASILSSVPFAHAMPSIPGASVLGGLPGAGFIPGVGASSGLFKRGLFSSLSNLGQNPPSANLLQGSLTAPLGSANHSGATNGPDLAGSLANQNDVSKTNPLNSIQLAADTSSLSSSSKDGGLPIVGSLPIVGDLLPTITQLLPLGSLGGGLL